MRLLYPSIHERQEEKRESEKHLRAYINKPKKEIKLDQNNTLLLENISVTLGGIMGIINKFSNSDGTANSGLED
jgi:hypothetical protein